MKFIGKVVTIETNIDAGDVIVDVDGDANMVVKLPDGKFCVMALYGLHKIYSSTFDTTSELLEWFIASGKFSRIIKSDNIELHEV